ncbi:MAG TPA: SCO family protein [Acidiferrobacterales bacterium]|nr:SCO family protein [Acidiferrobacterales bacterium]
MEKARPKPFARLKMIALMAVFAFPIALASLLYSVGWRPQGTINHGELVQPARPIQDVRLQTLAGEPLNFSRFQKKWTMLYFDGPKCADVCRENLRKMRQVHLAQGKDVDRIQRVFVVMNAPAPNGLREVIQENPELKVLTGSAENIKKLAGQFSLRAGTPFGLHRIYVLDPLGNFIMSYPPSADPNGIRKDFNRLLRVSQIG